MKNVIWFIFLFWLPIGNICLLVEYCRKNKITFIHLITDPLSWKYIANAGILGIFTPIIKPYIDKKIEKQREKFDNEECIIDYPDNINVCRKYPEVPMTL